MNYGTIIVTKLHNYAQNTTIEIHYMAGSDHQCYSDMTFDFRQLDLVVLLNDPQVCSGDCLPRASSIGNTVARGGRTGQLPGAQTVRGHRNGKELIFAYIRIQQMQEVYPNI
jgi:hypothetical protein